jgi:hypothetical protein
MKHAFREQDTPNADEERLSENSHIGAKSSQEAMDKINDLLPDKIRKNGVMAIEYLITASPEDMNGKSLDEQNYYFHDSIEWLKQKHGAENLAYIGVHRDETTPHMYAYVVPIDDKGKLNARHFLGGAKALNEMQTDFAEKVGKKHGLERGIEGSKAQHRSIQNYYAHVNAVKVPQINRPNIPDPKLLESKKSYGERVSNDLIEKLKPDWDVMRSKASNHDLEREIVLRSQAEADRLKLSLNRQMREKTTATNKLDGIIKTLGTGTDEQVQLLRNEAQKTVKRESKRSNDLGR